MMRQRPLLLFLAAALLLTSCHSGGGGGDDSGKSDKGGNDKKKDAGDQPGGPMKLDAAAQHRAGLQFETVERRSVHGHLYASGRIAINEERTAHVGAVTEGRVVELSARIGDHVRRGQVLGRFHSHDVHEAIAAYKTDLADLQRRRNALNFAQVQRDRYHRLFEIKSASRQEVEQSEANYQSAQTDVRDAQIKLEADRTHIVEFLQIPIQPDGSVDESHESVPITSPINGVVIARPITIGAVVAAGAETFTIADMSNVWMLASVNETDISKLHIGLPAQIRIDAFPDVRFPGSVTYLGTELDPTTRTLQARLLVANPGQRLRPEMYANAEFPEPQTREAMFLPEEALQDLNGNTVVFVRKNGDEFEARPVKLGKRDAGQVEVIAGVKPGEQAVVKGGFLLKSQMLRSTIEGG